MVKFGVFIPFYAFGPDSWKSSIFGRIKEITLECEELGYHSIWLDDHLMYGQTPILECWTVLSALSAVTARIRLGTLVLSAAFRKPAVLAKMAATLDVITNGRLELGLGAGVQKEAHIAYGFSFPSLKERADRLMETIEIIKALWSGEETTYHGQYFEVEKAICLPKPVQAPHPPIVIGGRSEHLLRVAAKHADRCDWGPLSSRQYRQKLATFEKYCKTFDRNPEDVEKACWLGRTIYIAADKKELDEKILKWKPKDISTEAFKRQNFVGTPEDFIHEIQKRIDMGINFFMLYFGELPDKSSLEIFAERVLKEF